MQRLIKAVCPSFPEDRNVKPTLDRISWYRINAAARVLYVPPVNILKMNPVELDKFVEAVNAFAVCNVNASEYDWDHLNLHDVRGEAAVSVLKQLKAECHGKKVACDIETRRVEWEDNKLLSFGVATDANTCIAFHNLCIEGASGYDTNGHSIALWQAMQDFFTDDSIEFTWHNGKFDCGRLKYLCNIDAHVNRDTMLRHYACINEKRGTHGLKDLGQLYLQAPAWDDELDRIKREWCREHHVNLGDFMYDDIPTTVLIPYMQRDCIATYRLDDLFTKLARPGSEFIYSKLIEASAAYMDIELAGMKLDLAYLEDLEWQLEQEAAEANKTMQAAAAQIWDPMKYARDTGAKSIPKEGFNIKSPKQLKWMLEEVLGYPVPNTNAVTMDGLLDEVESGSISNPVAKQFLSSIGVVRKNSKYMDTYVQGLRNVVCRDGRVRSTFNLHGTETGRLSSSDPNMQNIPRNKAIKNLIVSKPGYKLLQLDYSQAELRVLAVLSDDPFMIQIYRDGKDLHDAVATDMFGPNFDKEQRNLAKTINFGRRAA